MYLKGDSHTPEAGICAAQLMNHQQVREGLPEVKSHTQPVSFTISTQETHFQFSFILSFVLLGLN